MVTPTKTYTTDETLNRFSPEVRECYTDDEVQLKHLKSSIGFRYSLKNCFLDIVLDHLLKNCSCSVSVLKIDNVKVKSTILTFYKNNYFLVINVTNELGFGLFLICLMSALVPKHGRGDPSHHRAALTVTQFVLT